MIRVRGMQKSYRTRKIVTPVLYGVDLDIEDGEMVHCITSLWNVMRTVE